VKWPARYIDIPCLLKCLHRSCDSILVEPATSLCEGCNMTDPVVKTSSQISGRLPMARRASFVDSVSAVMLPGRGSS